MNTAFRSLLLFAAIACQSTAPAWANNHYSNPLDCTADQIRSETDPLSFDQKALADIVFQWEFTSSPQRLSFSMQYILRQASRLPFDALVAVFKGLLDEISERALGRGWAYRFYANDRFALYRGTDERFAVVIDQNNRVYIGSIRGAVYDALQGFEIAPLLQFHPETGFHQLPSPLGYLRPIHLRSRH